MQPVSASSITSSHRAASAKPRSIWRRKSPPNPPSRVKIGKQAFYRQIEMPLAEAYKYASEVMVENMMARDAEEGISAFIDKRQAEMGRPLTVL